jgi:hypothetical protein
MDKLHPLKYIKFTCLLVNLTLKLSSPVIAAAIAEINHQSSSLSKFTLTTLKTRKKIYPTEYERSDNSMILDK